MDIQIKYAGFTYNKALSCIFNYICAIVHINLFNNSRKPVKNQLKLEKITISVFNSAFFIDFFLIIFYYLGTYKYITIPRS